MSSVMNMVSASTIISVSVALTVALANGLGPRGTKMSKLHKTQPSDASLRLSKRSSLAKKCRQVNADECGNYCKECNWSWYPSDNDFDKGESAACRCKTWWGVE